MYYEFSLLHSTFINRRSTLVKISYFVLRISYLVFLLGSWYLVHGTFIYFRIKFSTPCLISPVSLTWITQKYAPTGTSLPL